MYVKMRKVEVDQSFINVKSTWGQIVSDSEEMLTKEAGGEEKDVPNAHLSLFLLLGVLLYGLGKVFFTLYIETVGQTLIAKKISKWDRWRCFRGEHWALICPSWLRSTSYSTQN